MATSGKIRFNNSTWQVELQRTAPATPVDSISNVRLGFLVTDAAEVNLSKQNTLKGVFDRMLMRVRDDNLMEGIGTNFPNGIMVTASRPDFTKDQMILTDGDPSGFWNETATDGDIVMFIPAAAGWSLGQGSTVDLNTLGARLWIAFSEQFTKRLTPAPYPVP